MKYLALVILYSPFAFLVMGVMYMMISMLGWVSLVVFVYLVALIWAIAYLDNLP